MSLIVLDKVHVRFGGHHVLHDISLSIPRGQTLVVIGESGFGGEKSNPKVMKLRAAQKGAAELPEFKGSVVYCPTAAYWRDESHGDGGYHFNGNCETYYDMGTAFGKAMLTLLKK